MVNRMLEKIESTKRMITFRRTQIEQTAKFIRKASKQNREELSNKFQTHVDALKTYFDDFKRR